MAYHFGYPNGIHFGAQNGSPGALQIHGFGKVLENGLQTWIPKCLQNGTKNHDFGTPKSMICDPQNQEFGTLSASKPQSEIRKSDNLHSEICQSENPGSGGATTNGGRSVLPGGIFCCWKFRVQVIRRCQKQMAIVPSCPEDLYRMARIPANPLSL